MEATPGTTATAVWISRRLLGPSRDEHLSIAIGLHRRYDSGPLHVLDQARGPVVADPQVTLHERDGGPARPHDDIVGLIVQRVLLARRFTFAPARGFLHRRLEHIADVFGFREALQVLDYLVHLVVGDERAVHALRQPGS